MSQPDKDRIDCIREWTGDFSRWQTVGYGDGTWRAECRNGQASPRFQTEEEVMDWLTEQWEAWQRAEASIYGGP